MSAPAKKSSANDKDMEKDTWNFKSITDDDPMDFGFGSPAKDKKNTFKLDMGFDLDGDFGNTSSFKMDMPDFDFSSPAKKTTKAKESSEASDDKSSGKAKQKKDLFSSFYDFDALDDFSLDPTPPKKGSETTSKTTDCKETAAGRKFDQSDALDFDLDLPVTGKATSKAKTDVKANSSTKTMECKETDAGRKFNQSNDLDFGLDLPVTGKAASKAKTDVKANAMTKTMDYEETAAGRIFDKSDALDFGPDLPVTRQAASKENTDVKANASAIKENQISKTTDTMVFEDSTHLKQATLESMDNSTADELPQSPRMNNSRAQTMWLRPEPVNTSPLKPLSPITEEIDEPCSSNETVAISQLHDSETAVNRETSPDVDESCRSVGTKEDSSREIDQNVNTTIASSSEKTEPNISSQLRLDNNERQQEEMATADTQAKIANETRRILCDPDTEYSQKNLSGKMSSGTHSSQTVMVHDSIAKPPLAPSHRVRDTDIQAETGDQTKRTLDPDPQHPQKTLPRKISPGGRPIQTVQIQDSSAKLPVAPSHSVKGKDTQVETGDHTKTTLDPDPEHSQITLSGKITPGTRPSQTSQVQDSIAKQPLTSPHSMPGLNDLKTVRSKDSEVVRSRFFKKPEQPKSDMCESSLARTESQPATREMRGLTLNSTADRSHPVKEAFPVSKTRTCQMELVNADIEKNAANVNTSSSSHEKKTIDKDHSKAKTVEHGTGLLDRSNMQAKNTTRERSMLQINISSKLDASTLTEKLSKHLSPGAESLQKSKIVSLERPKLGNIMSDLRAAKTQRTVGVNKDQPTSSTLQPEVSSSIINKERKPGAPVQKSPEIHHLAPRGKTQTLQLPSSLKRKALDEDADRVLKPQLKRLAMSPKENRNVEDLTHRVVVQGKSNSPIVHNSPRTINMANVEIPITENDDNVEKAEAYTKELENICNILKKKHEEAKELLVRAVVNNNKLLMLNHPLYEDKIRMVQKFAAKLTSNEQHMMQTQTAVA